MIDRLSLPEEEKPDGVSFLRQKSVRETYRLHTHDFFELFYIVNGKAVHEINGESKLLSKGDFVFIRPDDRHKYSFLDNFDMEIISVGFDREHFKAAATALDIPLCFFEDTPLPPSVNLRGYDSTDIFRKLCDMGKIQPGNGRREYFRAILPFLLYKFTAVHDIPLQPPQWLQTVMGEMSKRENFTVGLPRLIELSCASQEHVTRVFRRFLNVTPTEFVNIMRLEYAADLITAGETDVTEICFSCGFGNLSHFYRCFKKRYGCTPGQYR
ncbi:MAG: helix-turn-helix domain-containing protein [Ruminococcus sp.]|nr:helix-turn-helix domain-containing protein [Ruminococcus sp.]